MSELDARWQETADALGMELEDFMTLASYETGGTLNPMQAGPTTKWGQHRGLIQFGEPQAQEFGVDFSTPETALNTQLGKDGAIVNYMLAHGFKPGEHGPMDAYATINAGSPTLHNASDEAAGGAPGTVADKFNNQMGGHRASVRKRLGEDNPLRSFASTMREATGAATNTAMQAAVGEVYDPEAPEAPVGQDTGNPLFNDPSYLAGGGQSLLPPQLGNTGPHPPMPQPGASRQGMPPQIPNTGPHPPASNTGPHPPIARPSPVPQVTQDATEDATEDLPPAPKDATEEEKKATFKQRMAEKLFPNAEDPNKSFNNALQALSLGLGQMSQGNQVDMSSLFNRIALTRQNSIDNAQNLRENAFDQNLSASELAVKQSNARVAIAREVRLSEDADGTSQVDYTSALTAYPELAETIKLAQSGNPEAAKQVAQYAAAKAEQDQFEDPASGEALQQYVGAKNSAEKFAALKSAPQADWPDIIKAGNDIIGTDKQPSAVEFGEWLYEQNPSAYPGGQHQAAREAAKLQSGNDSGKSDERIAFDYKQSSAIGDELRTASSAAQGSNFALNDAAVQTSALIAKGDEVGTAETYLSPIGNLIGSFMGTESAEAFYELTGLNPDQQIALDAVQAAMMRAIARSFSGQGSISDKERAQMAKEVIREGMTNQQRMSMIHRLRALNELQISDSTYFNRSLDYSNDNENWSELQHNMDNASSIREEIVRASREFGTHSYYTEVGLSEYKGDKYEAYMRQYGGEENSAARNSAIYARIPASYAKMYRSALPLTTQLGDDGNPVLDAGGAAVLYPTYIDKDTGKLVQMEPN